MTTSAREYIDLFSYYIKWLDFVGETLNGVFTTVCSIHFTDAWILSLRLSNDGQQDGNGASSVSFPAPAQVYGWQ